MNDCTCGSKTADHENDCPHYWPPVLETREKYLERLERNQAVTSEAMRRNVTQQMNGSSGLPR